MKNFGDLYEKTTSVIQRRKMGRRMARLQKLSSFQFKKKKAALKMRSPAKLHQIARKKLIQKYRDKFYPQYKEMSVQQRVVVCLLYTSPSPRDLSTSRMPSSA